jgi:hypothetical protein
MENEFFLNAGDFRQHVLQSDDERSDSEGSSHEEEMEEEGVFTTPTWTLETPAAVPAAPIGDRLFGRRHVGRMDEHTATVVSQFSPCSR